MDYSIFISYNIFLFEVLKIRAIEYARQMLYHWATSSVPQFHILMLFE
jgi:hypothetical protein